ncbi:MAG TPA: PAS domain S-box protein [Chitinolyticbacter sp.]|nr:PAS domain S-box protein [Chitinolyticbacter sp.]
MNTATPQSARIPPESLLDALGTLLPQGLAVIDTAQRVVCGNHRFAMLLGLAPEALPGQELPRLTPALADAVLAGMHCAPSASTPILPAGPLPGAGPATYRVTLQPLAGTDDAAALWLLLLSPQNDDASESADAVPLRSVLDSLFAFVGVLALDGTLLEANRAPLEAAGISLADVRGYKFWDCYWWSHDPVLQQMLRDDIAKARLGQTVRRDVTVRMAGDSRMEIDFMLAPLTDGHGRVTHLIPSGIDISGRQRSEAALRLSEERFRHVVETAPEGLVMVDPDGTMLLVNAGLEAMFGYRREELLGHSIMQLIPERYRARHPALMASFMRDPAVRDMAGRKELYASRKDGSEFPVEIGLNPIPSNEGLRVLATIHDVTQRKAEQQTLQRALDEKTALLKEVHHRVKNNLQVISSLLNLQSRHASTDAQRALAESQGRVKAMALIHQLLYERNDFSHVDITAYLGRLCRLLQETQGRGTVAVALQLSVEVEHAWLDLQRAVPCGLLINELVTNAYKHAFAGREHGTIAIGYAQGEAGRHCLTVADDGIGLPVGIEDGSSQTLGFQLIPLLVEQLDGTMTISRNGGTRFLIQFEPDVGPQP